MKQLGTISLILFSLNASSLNANAQSIDEHDVVSWMSTMITLRFGETPYVMQTFAQTRFTQQARRFQTTVFSIWGLYRFLPSTSIGFGYTHHQALNPKCKFTTRRLSKDI